MFHFFENDERESEFYHCHIVLQLLFPADEDSTETVHPAVGAFNDPPPCALSGVPVRHGIFPPVANVRSISILPDKDVCGFVVVSLVQAKIVLLLWRRGRAKSDCVVQGIADELHVMYVCSGYGESQRDPVGV